MKKQNERYKMLSEELNSIVQNNISEYDSKKAYKEGPRHEYLLCVLNDSIEEMFEKYRNNGNEIYNFLENNKTKQNLITLIGKDSKYDLNYLNSIYDDLLCGIGMNYNFQDSEFVEDNEKKKHSIVSTLLISVIILAMILTIIFSIIFGIFIYKYFITILIVAIVIGFYMGKHGMM